MKPIGEILIEEGLITRDQLNEALEQQKKANKKRLGEILIHLGVINEDDLVVALSMQFNLAYLPLKNVSVNRDVCDLLPVELVRRHSLFPVEQANRTLTVAMSDPTDEKAISEIEKLTKCRVQVLVSTISEVENAIRSYYDKR